MTTKYESPTIESMGGDDLIPIVSAVLIFVVYILAVFAKYAAGVNVAAVVNVGAGVNTFWAYNWAWFVTKKKKKRK